ncbi:hypothetical protein [Vibrio parahaemolyticus]|uniref:hypothetical protein n=1 Tax=Vibrio parahaemolyticus TaxID=670 RepID=UPI002B21E9F6|nr:hypothetical protein [Vibrio parahaemolyticus]MEA5295165.1 hypothetical protein [Vibrio parahaemolyticus]
MNRQLYLDTSGLNFLADKIKDTNFIASAKTYLEMELYLSPVTLWEILLNSNEKRRDELIYWAQFNCGSKLLKSPTEILIEYIQAGCPQSDKALFREQPFTAHEMGQTWEDIHQRHDLTIPIDFEDLKAATAAHRELSKRFKRIIENMCSRKDETYDYEKDMFHIAMLTTSDKLELSESVRLKHEVEFKIALVFVFFFVCVGFELQNDPLNKFWEPQKELDPVERFYFILEEYPSLMVGVPVLEMALMAKAQITMENCKSRGLVHDCMHALYSYYADYLLTGDEHFAKLRDETGSKVFSRIMLVSELEKAWFESQKS